jgi:hypothetical protein
MLNYECRASCIVDIIVESDGVVTSGWTVSSLGLEVALKALLLADE